MKTITEERYNGILERVTDIVQRLGFQLVMNSQEVEGDFRRGDSYTLYHASDDSDCGEGDLAWCAEEALRYQLDRTVRGRYGPSEAYYENDQL